MPMHLNQVGGFDERKSKKTYMAIGIDYLGIGLLEILTPAV